MALKDAKNVVINKVAREFVDVGKAVDIGITWTKNNLYLGRQAVTPDGAVYRVKETVKTCIIGILVENIEMLQGKGHVIKFMPSIEYIEI